MERIDLGKGRFLIEMSPEEIKQFNENNKSAMELVLRAFEILQKDKACVEPVSEAEREIGGIIHAVVNENLPIEEAEARIKLIAELNASGHPTEDK